MARFTPHPDQLPLNWSDNEAIEVIVEQRLAERFEAESFQWRFRLVMIETVMMGMLVLVAGLLLKQPTMMVLRASLLVAGSCLATGLLLLSLSAGTAKLMSRLRRWRRR
ncbi:MULTISPECIES: hypothetical protein [unclassified Novosphingobium]|uniref:hypothetical protein n=1 Tax=unclassified Novosphingobium TaxID=2644732 RepID=UPI001494EA24|nr:MULTISPECIES: hypothetical protein [unclassified Novosphingobium]MBB3357010.1 hypothetical protein [Novosphingobium sp. BK256]MBB3373411.1 hypothetical protein [Novosphingobium sp. BK280]MBB3377780.1 hypothetical protein [Novosphingobium sp. BK258]MBB3418809.1 hypothetical protein [Novosphingobium sp. BK267]MBB3450356.1 hypothetical protein [Novosphingobium sp. BK352]